MILNELLGKVDKLFLKPSRKGSYTYNYTLGRFPRGWQFNLVNNWYAWSDRGLKYSFGLYAEPEHAVIAFLDYVKEKKINVKRLCNK